MIEKIKSWGKIGITIIVILIILILVYILRVPLTAFIKSIRESLHKSIDDGKTHSATQIAEENNSAIPEAPKNYKKIAQDSKDRTKAILVQMDAFLGKMQNEKSPK